MADSLVEKIINRLFPHEETALTVVRNRDGFLNRPDVQAALHYAGVNIFYGNSLNLRITFELELDEETRYLLFIQDEDFDVMPDIALRANVVTFQASKLFPHYHWETIRDRDYYTLKWLAAQKQIVYLTPERTALAVHEYDSSQTRVDDELQSQLAIWNDVVSKIDFQKPQKWASQLSDVMLRAIELDRWQEMIEPITSLNLSFQDFLRQSYNNVKSSTLGRNCPRVVKQILPFIVSHNVSKSALIVVDGMNLWQAKLLSNHIAGTIDNITTSFEACYSWLPSTTELSRQAIFRGDFPIETYNQNPNSEEKLWQDTLRKRGVKPIEAYYQFGGDIDAIPSLLKFVGYVTLSLDEMMHSAANYMYLYDDTRRWVEDGQLQGIAQRLLDAGFTVYITTDHGNIETQSKINLAQHDKIGANYSSRHITLHPSADTNLFARSYAGRVQQLTTTDRTFYPTDRDTFSREANVTHGGTHWLEVTIPFITIKKL